MPPSDPNPRAVIGDNQPPEAVPGPEPTPFEIAEKAVTDICDEARLWLDGNPIDSQDMADGVANLLASIRAAEALADETRKAEKAPLDTAITEIQNRYAPLIGNTKAVKGKTIVAAEACKQALAPWLQKKAAEIEAEAQRAREAADAKRRAAEDALRASDAANIAEREAAEALLRDARRAETAANVAERKTATAGGMLGRAVGIRTTWVPELTDATACAKHYWLTDRAEFDALLLRLAERDLRAGKRGIPGVVMVEKKAAA